jgi:hypothetical protein
MGIDTSMLKEITEKVDENKKFEVDEFLTEWYSLAYGDIFDHVGNQGREVDDEGDE